MTKFELGLDSSCFNIFNMPQRLSPVLHTAGTIFAKMPLIVKLIDAIQDTIIAVFLRNTSRNPSFNVSSPFSRNHWMILSQNKV